MERLNFQAVEKKWQKKFSKFKLSKPKGKSSIVWKCFHTLLEKFTWDMSEIILSVMLLLDISI